MSTVVKPLREVIAASSPYCKAVLHDGVIAWLHPKGGRTIHPSSKFHQSSHSSVFCPVSSWARHRETDKRNKTCQSSAISLHNQPISNPQSSSTLFSNNYRLRSSCGRTREGSPSLESSHSSTSLAMNEGLTPGCLSFTDHLIKCQYTKIILW